MKDSEWDDQEEWRVRATECVIGGSGDGVRDPEWSPRESARVSGT